jgi:hypothetical protein
MLPADAEAAEQAHEKGPYQCRLMIESSPEATSVERSKADSFTAYLEAKQRLKATATAPGGTGSTPLSLLLTLAEAPLAEMKLIDLQAASGMPFEEFAEAVKNLGASGYLAVAGPPGNEIVILTERGRDVSSLARPA